MGIVELPASVTANLGIVGTNIADIDFTGPLNVYIRSDSLSGLRKRKTPYSKNKNIENIISPLELNDDNYFTVPYIIEIFLSKKSTISAFDIQIVDEQGDIINLNGNPIRINFYFYTS